MISDFISNHTTVVAVLVSVLWFLAGGQYFRGGHRITGLSWQGIGVICLLIYLLNAIRLGDWIGSAVALLAATAELALMYRSWRHSVSTIPIEDNNSSK